MSLKIVDHPTLGQTRLALANHSKKGTTYFHNDGCFYSLHFSNIHCPAIVTRREGDAIIRNRRLS